MYGNRKTYKKSYRKATRKGKSKPKTKVSTKLQNKTVRSIVKKEIANNIENKMTINVDYTGSVLTIQTDASNNISYNYGIFNPVTQGLFGITQGVQQNQRIGNKIKLKRWIVKGSIYMDPVVETSLCFPQQQCYVNLYLGRKNNLTEDVDTTLENLYQNGPSANNPQGLIMERLYSINKDEYKIYWHRRYKIGQASGASTAFVLGNNDYILNKEFGLDICRYVCKNSVLKYDDANTVVENALLSSLTMFCTITMANHDVTTQGIQAEQTFYSPVRWEMSSYAEYEDA